MPPLADPAYKRSAAYLSQRLRVHGSSFENVAGKCLWSKLPNPGHGRSKWNTYVPAGEVGDRGLDLKAVAKMLGDRAPETPATSLRVCRPGGPEGDGSPHGSHQKSPSHPRSALHAFIKPKGGAARPLPAGPLRGPWPGPVRKRQRGKGVPCPTPVGGGGRRPLRHNAASYRAVLTELCVSFEKVIWISLCYRPQL